jgi:enoyl-CoA hydratase/carnithine racemase
MFETSWRDSDTVAVVMLENPPANALGSKQIDELSVLLDTFAGNDRLRAIIFRSRSRFFSAGADIALMAEAMRSPDGADQMADLCRRMQQTFAKLETIEVPTFAAISGICVGGGLELALACDFRIAEKDAVIGLPEVKIGLLPGAGGTQRLTAIAGRGVAARLIMTGDMISGERAENFGIIQELAAPGQAFERSLDMARAVIAAPRQSLQSIKRCLALATSPAGFEAEIAETRALHLQPQTRERISAFLEKTSKKRVAS